MEFCSTTWKQPALGLHALHTQLGGNWLVQFVPSELKAKQTNLLIPNTYTQYQLNVAMHTCTCACRPYLTMCRTSV